MVTAVETVQARIDAEQDLAAIIYGQRTLEWLGAAGRYRYAGFTERGVAAVSGTEGGEWVAAQLVAAEDAALRLGETGAGMGTWGGNGERLRWIFRKAKKTAQAAVKEARAAEKALGTKTQLRLALAA